MTQVHTSDIAKRLLNVLFTAVFIMVGLATPPAAIISPVARAISECDKFAIDKGSLLTDNKFCSTSCDSTGPANPTTGLEPGPVYILGDSIGNGLLYKSGDTDPSKGPLAQALPSTNGWSVTGDAVVGRALSTGVTVATQGARPGLASAKAVLVVLGTNNLTNSDNADKIAALIAAIKAAPSSATIFWLKTNVTRPDIKGKDVEYNKLLDATSGITTIANTATIRSDGLHPVDYPALAKSVATSITGSSSSSTPNLGSTNSEETAVTLAQKMLQTPNIMYWTNNGVNTRGVVEALSQGKKAYTTANNAPNKDVDININILKFILEVAQSNKVMVNALTDKTHSNGSNHYKGLAVDLDNNGSNSPPTSVLDPIAEKYGGKRNSETTHWHYDFTKDPQTSSSTPTTDTTQQADSSSCCNSTGTSTGPSANSELSQNIPAVWRNLIADAAPKYPDVNPNLVAAVLWVENRGWPEYKTSGWGVSSAGAAGPWQFIASTWASLGTDGDGDGRKDRDNPKDAVHAAFKHHLGSAGKPIVEGFDGNAQSSYEKAVFRRNASNLLYYAAKYNGSGAPDGVKLKDFPRGQNSDYVRFAYWLLATDFKQTSNNDFTGLIDAYTGPAAQGGKGGTTAPGGTSTNTSTSGSCTDTNSGSTGGGSVDGFPLITTQSVIKKGIDGGIWCYESDKNCHHDYNAADIHAPIDTRVIAAKPGRVVGVKDRASSCGSHVVVLGTDNFVYYYQHMKLGSIKVVKGQDIKTGDAIGAVGPNACGTAPHLHFDMQAPPATNRPSCSGAECTKYSWVDVQPILVPLFKKLPQ